MSEQTTPLQADLSAASKAAIRSRKHMVFTIGEERYAIPLTEVKEVIGLTKITDVPGAPSYFKGLINLRGRIISTIDLRDRLGKGATTSRRPCIIITEIQEVLVGTIVDDVVEVVGIDESQLTRLLDLVESEGRKYVKGAAKFENKPLTLLLDIGKAIDIEQLLELRRRAQVKTDAA